MDFYLDNVFCTVHVHRHDSVKVADEVCLYLLLSEVVCAILEAVAKTLSSTTLKLNTARSLKREVQHDEYMLLLPDPGGALITTPSEQLLAQGYSLT